MKILVLTSRLPAPRDRGDRLRAGAFVADLAAEHEVHLVSFGPASDRHIAELRQLVTSVRVVPRPRLYALASVTLHAWRGDPLQVSYYRSRRMRRLIDELLATGGFDLTYVQMLRMAPYVIDGGGAGDTYSVVDLTDVVSSELERSLPYRSRPGRLLYRFEAARVARFERWVARHADEIWLISEHERQTLLERCRTANATVVPNRIELEYFPPPRPDAGRAGRLVFLGNFDVAHNLDAARFLVDEILPALRRREPNATVRLVGPGGGRAIRRLDGIAGVTATGWVDDLAAELRTAELFVAPLRFCAGVQNKVIEAMAAGVPVVTTSLVQKGLDAVAGEHLAVADSAEDLASICANLLHHPDRRAGLAAAGEQLARDGFTAGAAGARVRSIEDAMRSSHEMPASRRSIDDPIKSRDERL